LKFNLKTRPKAKQAIPSGVVIVSHDETVEAVLKLIDKYEEWFEGFEKELREKLERVRELYKECIDIEKEWSLLDLMKLLEEILGERKEGE